MNIRSVRLELVRPGPPHNQLLSPLTSYIALCGDEPPEILNVPFEHYRLLRQIHVLRRARTRTEIDAAMTELRQDVVRMLASIRCLSTSLAQAHGDGADLIEIELILSAYELSIIPFELAFLPGSPTRELAHREVVITRRSRRVPRSTLTWGRRPRILVVSAAPEGVRPPPVRLHVEALREALAPYLIYLDGDHDRTTLLHELKKFLVVLPYASEYSIQTAIQEAFREQRPFSHVHVVAHGGELLHESADAQQGHFREPRFGIVFHNARSRQRSDVLSGRRLFSALAGTTEDCRRRLPQVVTLATCDGANQGGVVIPSASVAHDIHDGGVPLVIASQFPLSYSGSVVFVKRLYERLLEADDPRCSQQETRRAMHAAGTFPFCAIDWTAIVSYGSFSDNLLASVREARIRALQQQTDSALSSVDPNVVPPGRGDPSQAWAAVSRGFALLEQELAACEADVRTIRYVARQHLRWAFLMWAGVSRETGWEARRTESAAEGESPFSSTPWLRFAEGQRMREGGRGSTRGFAWKLVSRNLRAFRDGSQRHYQATGNPISLADKVIGDFFLGDHVDKLDVDASATECRERILGTTTSREERRRFERAQILLWILYPVVAIESADQPGGPPKPESKADRNWVQDILDRQLAVTAPSDFEHFDLYRSVDYLLRAATAARAPQITELEPSEIAPERLRRVRRRAAVVQHWLEKRGVASRFTAIVDWVSEADGGLRTVAT